MTFNLLNIYFYKIIELRKFCNEFTISINGTKTNIINRILQYYLINTHNKKIKLCNDMRCKTCFYNSFLSNSKSLYWSTKNNLHPRFVCKSNNNSYIFNCNVCNHEFTMRLTHITSRNSWCNYCSNTILCENNDCEICFNKSFASHEKAIYWSNKNSKNPREVSISNGNSYIFNCNVCNHEFTSSLNNIFSHNSWCSYCANQKLCENNNCEICFNKSFASHEKAIYWSNKNIKNPREVFISSGNKFIFNCNVCNHEFTMRLYHITSRNSWCPICVNKTEKLLNNYFVENNINFIKEYTLTNGKYKNSNNLFRYDFYLTDYNILIELDGRQHFEYIKPWKNDCELNCIKDCYKMKYIIENIVNIKIIRISQEDVYNNKINYKEILNNLNNLQQITYISNDEKLYDNHKQYMKLNINELNIDDIL